jgi:hypothetical protein
MSSSRNWKSVAFSNSADVAVIAQRLLGHGPGLLGHRSVDA